jgi:hypothetical protein
MNFNELMSGLSKNSKEIAAKIAGSNYTKNIIPGKQDYLNEVNNFINNNKKMNYRIHSAEAADKIANDIMGYTEVAKELGENINIDKKTANTISNSIFKKNFSSDSFDSLQQKLEESGIAKQQAEKIANEAQNVTNEVFNKNYNINDLNKIQKGYVYSQAYFNNPDKKITGQRIGTAIGAYVGINAGGRFLSGGTLTTDNYGQKDIAGIPFI